MLFPTIPPRVEQRDLFGTLRVGCEFLRSLGAVATWTCPSEIGEIRLSPSHFGFAMIAMKRCNLRLFADFAILASSLCSLVDSGSK